MKATCVTVWVKPGHIQDFINATIQNHNQSIKEPGNLRFDFLQSETEPGRFFLYEVYETNDAAAAHKETTHYRKWRDTVAPMMEKPREGHAHSIVKPEEKSAWK